MRSRLRIVRSKQETCRPPLPVEPPSYVAITLGGKWGEGSVAYVDAKYASEVLKHKWHISVSRKETETHKCAFYARATINKVRIYLHHFIMNLAGIPKPASVDDIDHRNGCTLNNTLHNLEWLTSGDNSNKQGIMKTNKTGFKNVSQNANGSYKVQIRRNKVDKYIGTFYNLDEAVAARDAAYLAL